MSEFALRLLITAVSGFLGGFAVMGIRVCIEMRRERKANRQFLRDMGWIRD